MRITRNLLFFIFAACLLIPSFSTPYQASAKDTPIDFFNLELPLIDDEIKSSLEKYGEGLELNNGLAIFRKKTGQTGKINISISNLTKQDNYYSIDGIVTVHLNNDVIQFDFKQQYLYVVESSPGHIIYYYDIDSKYFDGKKNRMSSILAVTIPSQDKEYASITVGELGSEGIFLLEFGERYITDTLEETLYNSMSNEIISNYVQPDDANIQSTVDWGEYTYKATVETAFADDYDYWGRAAVLSIGRKYVENCSCGEVVLRAFAPVEDVQNETNDTVFPNKIKMGVQHHDGQVNNAYPQASSSSSGNTIIYDLLNVSGVPTNTLQAIANGFTANHDIFNFYRCMLKKTIKRHVPSTVVPCLDCKFGRVTRRSLH